MTHTMQNEVDTLIQNICNDYAGTGQRINNQTESQIAVREKMVAEFNAGIGYTVGRKYIKITQNNNGSVWGFVVAADDDKMFARGTILKAAGWATPARNFSRGNVVDGGYTVRWTGA